MSCENIFKDICHIHARLFDHRSAFQGHIAFFAKEFEEKRADREKTRLDHIQELVTQCKDHTNIEKRGDREKTRLDHIQESVTQCKDHTLPNVESCLAEQLPIINKRTMPDSEKMKEAEEACKIIAELENNRESEFLNSQRVARQHALDQFMEQQCIRSSRVDQHFEENVKLFNASYEELSQQLSEGIPFTNQTFYKFMALGKEFS